MPTIPTIDGMTLDDRVAKMATEMRDHINAQCGGVTRVIVMVTQQVGPDDPTGFTGYTMMAKSGMGIHTSIEMLRTALTKAEETLSAQLAKNPVAALLHELLTRRNLG